MYRLPFHDGAFDTAVMQMVLHYAEDPAGVITEAARVLRPGGRLVVVDLATHQRSDLISRLAHRWPGFDDGTLARLFADAGLEAGAGVLVAAPLPVRLWPAMRPAYAETLVA